MAAVAKFAPPKNRGFLSLHKLPAFALHAGVLDYGNLVKVARSNAKGLGTALTEVLIELLLRRSWLVPYKIFLSSTPRQDQSKKNNVLHNTHFLEIKHGRNEQTSRLVWWQAPAR